MIAAELQVAAASFGRFSVFSGGSMRIKTLLGGAVLALLSVNAFAEASAQAGALKVLGHEEVSFKSDIQPILQDHCVSCHQPGGKGFVKSGLDLTSYQGLMKGTIYGPVVVPGNSDVSTFTKLLTGTNKGLKMPMGLNSTGTLDRQYILLMRKWVAQGARNN